MTADVLSALLRDELLRARRAGDRVVAATVRTTLAAFANAEAVPAEPPRGSAAEEGSEHVAGARLGVGAGEAARRELTAADRRALVEAEITSLQEAARLYDEADPARAEETRRGAAALVDVLTRVGTAQ